MTGREEPCVQVLPRKERFFLLLVTTSTQLHHFHPLFDHKQNEQLRFESSVAYWEGTGEHLREQHYNSWFWTGLGTVPVTAEVWSRQIVWRFVKGLQYRIATLCGRIDVTSPGQVLVESHPKNLDFKDSFHWLFLVTYLYHCVLKVMCSWHLRCREENHFCLFSVKTEVLLIRPSVHLVLHLVDCILKVDDFVVAEHGCPHTGGSNFFH